MNYKNIVIKCSFLFVGVFFLNVNAYSQNEAFFTPQFHPGQFFGLPPNPTVTIMNNNDVINNAKLKAITLANQARITAVEAIESNLEKTVEDYETIIDKQYSDNSSFSDNTSYRLKSTALVALGFTAVALSSNPVRRIQYALTRNKKALMDESVKANTLLIGLQFLDNDRMTVDERQEIYRLRREVLNSFIRSNKINRDLLLLPAALYAIKEGPDLLRFIQAMELSSLVNLQALETALSNNGVIQQAGNLTRVARVFNANSLNDFNEIRRIFNQ